MFTDIYSMYKVSQICELFHYNMAIYGLVRGGYLITTLYPYMGDSLFSVLYSIFLLIPYLTVFLGAFLVKIIWYKKNRQ